MKEKLKQEFLHSLQYFLFLILAIGASFYSWIFEREFNNGGHININLLWQNLEPFFLRIIFYFAVFSLIRLIIVGLNIWRRKQID